MVGMSRFCERHRRWERLGLALLMGGMVTARWAVRVPAQQVGPLWREMGPRNGHWAMRPSNWNVNESIQQTAAQWQLCGFNIPWGGAGIKEVASLPSRSSVEGEVS